MGFSHEPVLLEETVGLLVTDPEGIYVDGTVGGGGHSGEICRRLTGSGRLIGFDRDAEAVEAAGETLAPYSARVTLIHSNYREMRERLAEAGITAVDGILLDLGVSSHQLDDPSRGFTYRNEDALLDMRMDTRQGLTACDILAEYSEADLYRVIRDYGEEKFARNIAKHIVQARREKPIETAGELNAVIRAAIPAKARAGRGHPSKRTYQAIRIELNGELEALKSSLDDMEELLKPGGRLCILTFHSLEDRIVKTAFRKFEHPCTCPDHFPVCVCGKQPLGRVVTRRPIVPSQEEQERNKRAKSAKLRVFEKVRSDENRDTSPVGLCISPTDFKKAGSDENR